MSRSSNSDTSSLETRSTNEILTANPPDKVAQKLKLKDYYIVGILCFVNLINYVDRYTITGELFFPYSSSNRKTIY